MSGKKNQRPVNTRDIARVAGVNQSSVSRALRGDPNVSLKTQERIARIAEEMGYRPNPFVSAFTAQVRGYRRSPKHASIAVLNTYKQDEQLSFMERYSSGAVDRAEQLGFKVDRFNYHELDCKEDRLLQVFRSRGIHGLLILPLQEDQNLSRLNVKGLACASVDLSERSPAVSHVVPDYHRHMKTTMVQLIARGYRRIGYCARSRELSAFAQYSMSSFLLCQQELPTRSRLKPYVEKSSGKRPFSAGRDAFFQWLEKARPDAVVSNDSRFYRWMLDAKIDVPGEIGFAGLTVEDERRNVAGINQRQALVGAAAMDLVVSQIYRNEYGLPDVMKTVFIDGIWQDGKTIHRREG